MTYCHHLKCGMRITGSTSFEGTANNGETVIACSQECLESAYKQMEESNESRNLPTVRSEVKIN